MSFVYSLLDASTIHLKKETYDWLVEVSDSLNPEDIICYRKGENGFFIPVLLVDLLEKDIPEDLVQLLEYADKAGCLWMMIDQDGFIIPDLPQYNW